MTQLTNPTNEQELDKILKKYGSYAVLKDENRFDDEQMAREFPDELSLPEARAAILSKACDERVGEADEMRAILRGLSEELQEMKKLGRKYMRISDLEYSINKSIVFHERAKLKEVK